MKACNKLQGQYTSGPCSVSQKAAEAAYVGTQEPVKEMHVALSCLGTACNESSWLKETPYDFYTPENSYTTTDQFQNALNYLYDQVRGPAP